ncbi:MAG: GNAT family N-acetyltransferase [Gemmataceae bacterium]|nr:GNAT family N-acetyltransferase [Gemmataceae bacterium]
MTPAWDVVLETDRLVLRRFADTDADAALLVDLDSDPEVMRYIRPFAPYTADDYRDRIRTVYLAQYAAHPARGVFAAHEKAAGDFVGWFIFRTATEYRFAAEAGWTRPSDVELGYRLRRAAWGRGLATEGSKALVASAGADPEVTCVVSCALVPNRASTRVMEKCGLARVREVRLPGYDDPLVLYARCKPGYDPPGQATDQ